MMVGETPPSMTESTPVRLPHPVAEAVDRAVARFVGTLGIESHQRWQGADLWMIFDESLDKSSQTVLTRRITIGAYSDRADDLVITPDIVVVNSQGRRILPAEERRRNQVTLSIWKLTQNSVGGGLTGDDALAGEIATKLDEAWARAGEISPDQTYILLP